MKVKYVSGDRSFVHERSSLNAGMSMVVAALVLQVSGETSHAAFHVVANRPIIYRPCSPKFSQHFLCTGASATVESKRAVVQ